MKDRDFYEALNHWPEDFSKERPLTAEREEKIWKAMKGAFPKKKKWKAPAAAAALGVLLLGGTLFHDPVAAGMEYLWAQLRPNFSGAFERKDPKALSGYGYLPRENVKEKEGYQVTVDGVLREGNRILVSFKTERKKGPENLDFNASLTVDGKEVPCLGGESGRTEENLGSHVYRFDGSDLDWEKPHNYVLNVQGAPVDQGFRDFLSFSFAAELRDVGKEELTVYPGTVLAKGGAVATFETLRANPYELEGEFTIFLPKKMGADLRAGLVPILTLPGREGELGGGEGEEIRRQEDEKGVTYTWRYRFKETTPGTPTVKELTENLGDVKAKGILYVMEGETPLVESAAPEEFE